MFKTIQNRNLIVVNLTDKVTATTNIARENHAALRSGFVGYPPNPRWNTIKFCAWRTGCQWRNALAQGTMLVRGTDSMLVPVLETEVSPEEEEPPSRHYSENLRSLEILPFVIRIILPTKLIINNNNNGSFFLRYLNH